MTPIEKIPRDEGQKEITVKKTARWFIPLRIAWLCVAIISWALFIAGLPLMVEAYQTHYRTNFGIRQAEKTAEGAIHLATISLGQAARAGIMERDTLVAVNGMPVNRQGTADLQALIPAGEAGTEVVLSVQTGSHPVREVSLVRGGPDGQVIAGLGLTAGFMGYYIAAVEILTALAFMAVALLVFWRSGPDWVALLVSLTLVQIFVGAGSQPVTPYLYDANPQWQPALDIWSSLAVLLLSLAFYLFPTGRFIPRWSRFLTLLLVLWLILAPFYPALYFWRLPPRLSTLGFAALALAATGAQIYRYRYAADAAQKQQTKWIVYGTTFALLFGVIGLYVLPNWIAIPQPFYDLVFYPLTRFCQLMLPVTILFAIFRYRLWDIDLIINRTIVYGALTAVSFALYMLIVGGLGALFQSQGSLLITLIGVGAVATLFQPLRERLQRWINRLMYGERDDPLAALAKLGRRLEATALPEAMLPAIVTTVCQTLRVPYAAISLHTSEGAQEIVAETGTLAGKTAVYPLRFQGEAMGELLVSPRAPGERFSQVDERILRNLARQAGTAVHALQLMEELRLSRQRIVTAREEERRRLRRDLHDGLGPQLASQSLGMDAVDRLLEHDPQKAHALLATLKTQAQEAILDVRRLVYELRPPALDELGLVGALQSSIQRYASGTLSFVFEEPSGLPELTAAVEVAAYRIAQEAITNVVRHAQANICTIRLDSEGQALVLEVKDDGQGIAPGQSNGVGLQSMKERAAELNGRLTVQSKPGQGTTVRAVLPL